MVVAIRFVFNNSAASALFSLSLNCACEFGSGFNFERVLLLSMCLCMLVYISKLSFLWRMSLNHGIKQLGCHRCYMLRLIRAVRSEIEKVKVSSQCNGKKSLLSFKSGREQEKNVHHQGKEKEYLTRREKRWSWPTLEVRPWQLILNNKSYPDVLILNFGNLQKFYTFKG